MAEFGSQQRTSSTCRALGWAATIVAAASSACACTPAPSDQPAAGSLATDASNTSSPATSSTLAGTATSSDVTPMEPAASHSVEPPLSSGDGTELPSAANDSDDGEPDDGEPGSDIPSSGPATSTPGSSTPSASTPPESEPAPVSSAPEVEPLASDGGGVSPDRNTTESSGDEGDVAPSDPCAVKAVDAGNVHTCALNYSGEVWCWGNNTYAAVAEAAGDGAQRTPYPIEAVGSDNRDVIVGQDTSCAVKNDGRLVCWGSFGDGVDFDHVTDPTPFDVFGTDYKQVVLHTAACAVTADSEVACWGFGQSSARVISGFGSDVVQVSLSHDSVCAVTGEGSVLCGRIGGAAPTTVNGISGARFVSVGGALDSESDPWGRLLAATSDGSAYWAVGGGQAQQLTLAGNAVLETFIGETTASEHMYAARSADGVFTWGTNRCGALGDGLGGSGDTSHDHRDVLAQAATVTGLGEVSRLAVGHEHACAILSDHSLWCWGRNAEGQIGSGADDTVCASGDASPNQPSPIQIHLCPGHI